MYAINVSRVTVTTLPPGRGRVPSLVPVFYPVTGPTRA